MISIDFEADAAYVFLPGFSSDSDFGSGLRTRVVTDAVMVDLTPDGSTVGVEVLGLQAEIPIHLLVCDYDVPDETIRALLSISSARCTTSVGGSVTDTKAGEQQQ